MACWSLKFHGLGKVHQREAGADSGGAWRGMTVEEGLGRGGSVHFVPPQ